VCQSFNKDFFSTSNISWKKHTDDENLEVLKIIVNKHINSSKKIIVRQNSGREINSNNFKLIIDSKKFILKKWSKKIKKSEIKKIINLMLWLNNQRIKAPIPQKFKNNHYIIKNKNVFWSYFNYIDGNHFKGKLNEMKDVGKFIGLLFNKLKKYPVKPIKKTFKYFSKEDDNIIKFLNKNLSKLDSFFSKKHAKQLKKRLPEIIELFKILKNKKIKKRKKIVVHMDIHPHNIIMKNNKVNAILDLESCIKGEIGYALSYAILKICKQTVVFNKKKSNQTNIKEIFIKEIKKNYKINKSTENNLYFYALSEVIRRLIVMFKLSIKKNDRSWNNVIPIQLGHINECKIFFLNKS